MTLVEVIGFIGMTAGGILIGMWGGFKNRMKTLVVGMTAFGILAIGMGALNSFVLYLSSQMSTQLSLYSILSSQLCVRLSF